MLKSLIRTMVCAMLVISVGCTQTDQAATIEPGIHKVLPTVEGNEVLSRLEDEYRKSNKSEEQYVRVLKEIAEVKGRADKLNSPHDRKTGNGCHGL